jgi:hypothetical protein
VLRPDAGQCGLVREQGKLQRLGHWGSRMGGICRPIRGA